MTLFERIDYIRDRIQEVHRVTNIEFGEKEINVDSEENEYRIYKYLQRVESDLLEIRELIVERQKEIKGEED